jgi:hypothetical protein
MSNFIMFGIMAQGGKTGRLFICSAGDDLIAEINIQSFAIINQLTKVNPARLGGIKNRLYLFPNTTVKVKEINPDTLADITAEIVITGFATMFGLGGISTKLYANNSGATGEVKELNPSTLAVINTIEKAYIRSLGGINDRLYAINVTQSKVWELNASTLALINETSGNTTNADIGGINKKLFKTDSGPKTISEINVDTHAIIRTPTNPMPNAVGIDGVKL